MTVDKKIQLAQQVAVQLKQKWEQEVRREAELKKKPPKSKDWGFPRNEWEKWAHYAGRRGLQRALHLLQYMRRSPSLRQDPQKVARLTQEVIQGCQKELQALNREELREVLGYVSRWLVWLNASRAPFMWELHEKGSACYVRRGTCGDYRSH